MTEQNFLFGLMSLLHRKVEVPEDYHQQVSVINDMLRDDVSGIVDSLTDFSVNSAAVDFSVSTKNEELNRILKKWLNSINKDYNGRLPIGTNELSKEYFKERWKGSSFPVLKISEWGIIDGLMFPTKMFFVDGGSIYAKDKNTSYSSLTLFNYDYYLGREQNELLDKNCIITKPYGRWFDKYPTPYLIKTGVYHNWKLISGIKNKESELLEQVLPYMLLVKKGTEALARDQIKVYDDTDLKNVIAQFQELMDKVNTISSEDKSIKSPIRATNFDETVEHVIPDLSTIFDTKLFASAEKHILAGLGFIDVVDSVTASRKESILNPRPFIEEIKTGVEDFKQILWQLIQRIIDKNISDHQKWMNEEFYITSSPVKAFMTDDFKQQVFKLWRAGRLSDQSTVELVSEVDFRTEVHRKTQELSQGLDALMYPPVTDNREGQGIDLPSIENPKKPDEDTNGDEIPEDKVDEFEKREYDESSENPDLVTAPYDNIKALPKRVKDNLSADLQSVWLRVFNNAYKTYGKEESAIRVAWNVIKQIGRLNKKGLWVRKKQRKDGKLTAVSLTKANLQDAIEKEEKQVIDEALKMKELEIQEKKNKLLDRLLNDK